MFIFCVHSRALIENLHTQSSSTPIVHFDNRVPQIPTASKLLLLSDETESLTSSFLDLSFVY